MKRLKGLLDIAEVARSYVLGKDIELIRYEVCTGYRVVSCDWRLNESL